MAQNFTSPERLSHIDEERFERQLGQSSLSVPVYVHGYWSDVITIYVRREWHYSKQARETGIEFHWELTMSHSSGGRDTEQVKDDVEASANFGAAMLTAVTFARSLKERFDDFEAAYQAERRAAKAAAEAEEKAKQAKIDADPAVGEPRARLRLDSMTASAKELGRNVGLTIIARGSDGENNSVLSVETTRAGSAQYVYRGSRVSRKDAIKHLADASVRTLSIVNAKSPA